MDNRVLALKSQIFRINVLLYQAKTLKKLLRSLKYGVIFISVVKNETNLTNEKENNT